MKRTLKIGIVGFLGATAFATIFAPSAQAGCGRPNENRAGLPAYQPSREQGAVYRPAAFVLLPDRDDEERAAAIVGLWHVTFTSKGSLSIPDGMVIDSGYAQWHSDGTEIMNSSRPPATGSFCLGVWKKTGPATYKLNHIALSWNPDGTPVGPASIREEVTVDRSGNKYSGTFTITQYDLSGINVLPPTPIVGLITAYRIEPD